MNTTKYLVLFLACLCKPLAAQVYEDYLGNGHNIGVTVTSSDNTMSVDTSTNTISGLQLVPDLVGASRFLANATFGASYEDMEYVSQIGIKAWIDEQMALPYITYETEVRALHDQLMLDQEAEGLTADQIRRWFFVTFVHYDKMFKTEDILRQRMAQALNQILVVSNRDNAFMQRAYGLASYYDVLYEGAFGNYRDLLSSITMHPVMGIYLSHMQNRKADPVLGTSPDENYAREIMQLFTIGLDQLNLDGTPVLDAHGNKSPTYDNIHIEELAKVFTGLSGGAYGDQSYFLGTTLLFGTSSNHFNYTVPMIMYEEEHDTGTKLLVNGDTIQAGQPGLVDIEQALDVLFNHDNTGPFVCKKLIQHLVKSNPTPAYVKRIALVFNNNGAGVRGDLEAVLRAILTDPEAIECSWIDDVHGGKLIQPMERFTNLFHAFDISTPSNKFWFQDNAYINDDLEQSFYSSASVFNFFSPSYAESDFVAPEGLVSPEFEILHAVSSIHYINTMEKSIDTRPFRNNTALNPITGVPVYNADDEPVLDLTDEMALYETDGILAALDRIDLIVCRGQLQQDVKNIIAYVIEEYAANLSNYDSRDAIEDALYYVMMSPNYMIRK